MAPGPARIPQPHQRPFAPPGQPAPQGHVPQTRQRPLPQGPGRRPGLLGGLLGQVSQIASIHQNGLRDKPSLRTRAIEYPRRELLGTTPTDREHLLDLLYEQLAEA
jgi:hypothetical protein